MRRDLASCLFRDRDRTKDPALGGQELSSRAKRLLIGQKQCGVAHPVPRLTSAFRDFVDLVILPILNIDIGLRTLCQILLFCTGVSRFRTGFLQAYSGRF